MEDNKNNNYIDSFFQNNETSSFEKMLFVKKILEDDEFKSAINFRQNLFFAIDFEKKKKLLYYINNNSKFQNDLNESENGIPFQSLIDSNQSISQDQTQIKKKGKVLILKSTFIKFVPIAAVACLAAIVFYFVGLNYKNNTNELVIVKDTIVTKVNDTAQIRLNATIQSLYAVNYDLNSKASSLKMQLEKSIPNPHYNDIGYIDERGGQKLSFQVPEPEASLLLEFGTKFSWLAVEDDNIVFSFENNIGKVIKSGKLVKGKPFLVSNLDIGIYYLILKIEDEITWIGKVQIIPDKEKK